MSRLDRIYNLWQRKWRCYESTKFITVHISVSNSCQKIILVATYIGSINERIYASIIRQSGGGPFLHINQNEYFGESTDGNLMPGSLRCDYWYVIGGVT